MTFLTRIFDDLAQALGAAPQADSRGPAETLDMLAEAGIDPRDLSPRELAALGLQPLVVRSDR
ncbi:MAG: hypothetical protein AAGE18_11865 [Pseudomonadota bacterium]